MKFIVKEFDYKTTLRTNRINAISLNAAKVWATRNKVHHGAFIELKIYDANYVCRSSEPIEICYRRIGQGEKWKNSNS